ncbi:MAG: cell wall-active antibiotics response protein LiaF [Bacillota bacterium]|nr:cell wall-active antibiotics response protein LiaF [Bacillota bacterium]
MRKSFFQMLLALAIIVTGVALLLYNIGILDLDASLLWRYAYSVLFILFGIKAVADSLEQAKRAGYGNISWFWGVILILAGSLLFLGALGYINFTLRMLWRLWPLLLVYLGIALFAGSGRIHVHLHDGDDTHRRSSWTDEDGKEKEFRFSAGKIKRNQANWSAEAMDVWNAIGEYDLDYTRAYISETEIPVKLAGWIGDVRILVPRDVEFRISVKSLIGDVRVAGQSREGIGTSLSYKTPGYDNAERKLSFEIDYRILDLRIDSV